MLNEVRLIGHLGQDPQLRHTSSGTAVASFSLATGKKYKDKDGQVREKTQWHSIIAWRQLAENCARYLAKGKLVLVLGELCYRTYQDRDGHERFVAEIIANDVKFLEKPANGSSRAQACDPPPADDDCPF